MNVQAATPKGAKYVATTNNRCTGRRAPPTFKENKSFEIRHLLANTVLTNRSYSKPNEQIRSNPIREKYTTRASARGGTTHPGRDTNRHRLQTGPTVSGVIAILGGRKDNRGDRER